MAAAAQRSGYFQPAVGWDPRTGSSRGKELGSDSGSPKSVYQRGAGAEGKDPRRRAVTPPPGVSLDCVCWGVVSVNFVV